MKLLYYLVSNVTGSLKDDILSLKHIIIVFIMKHLLILLVGLALLSCDKKEINTNLSSEIRGVYQVYKVSNGANVLTLPYLDLSMEVTLTAIDKTSCKYLLAVHSNDGNDTDERVFFLLENNKQIDLYEDGVVVGFVKDDQLELNFEAKDGTKTIMKARKTVI